MAKSHRLKGLIMHFPKYWTTARDKQLTAWGWSDESVAHAASVAQERLARIKEWLRRRGKTPLQQRYGYSDGRPLREEVLREFRKPDGSLQAAMTRNSYGCLVLNTVDMMFVDVDAPEAKESSFLAGIFGFRKPQDRDPDAFMNSLTARVNDWTGRWPGWGWRVYRTPPGCACWLHTNRSLPNPRCARPRSRCLRRTRCIGNCAPHRSVSAPGSRPNRGAATWRSHEDAGLGGMRPPKPGFANGNRNISRRRNPMRRARWSDSSAQPCPLRLA